MDILKTNEKAWDKIGSNATTPIIETRGVREMFELFLKSVNKGKILDLGCGPGLPYTKIMVDKGFDVTGVDISTTMIDLAKKNVPKAKFIKNSITDIDFKEEFEGIFSSYVMLCLDPEQFKLTAEKIIKALKPNGYFLILINEPRPEGHSEDDNIAEIMGEKIYSRPYTEEEIKKYFNKLKTIKVERETLQTKNYGKEYCLMVLMQK